MASNGGQVTSLKADRSDPGQLSKAVDSIAGSLGGLDISSNIADYAALPMTSSQPMRIRMTARTTRFVTGSIHHVDNGFTA